MRACAVGKKISSYITLIFFSWDWVFCCWFMTQAWSAMINWQEKKWGIVTQKLFLYPFAANQGDWIIKQVIEHCKEINLFTSFFFSRDLKTDKQCLVSVGAYSLQEETIIKKRQQAQNCESLVLAHYIKFLFKGEGTINFELITEEW